MHIESVFYVIGVVTKPDILIDLVNPLSRAQLFTGEAHKGHSFSFFKTCEINYF